MTDISSRNYQYPGDKARSEHRVKFSGDWLAENDLDLKTQKHFFVPLGRDGDDYTGRIVNEKAVASKSGEHRFWAGGDEHLPAFNITSQGRIEICHGRIELPFGDYDAVMLDDGLVHLQDVVVDPVTFPVTVRALANGLNFILTPDMRDVCGLSEGEPVYLRREYSGTNLTLTRGCERGDGRATKMVTETKIVVSYIDAKWMPPEQFSYQSLLQIVPGPNFQITFDLSNHNKEH